MKVYNKYISKEDLKKKTGINICLFSDYNIAGNMTLLTNLINKHTIHKARCVILLKDYLDYDVDIELIDNGKLISKENLNEAEDIVKQADFFHIGRRAINFGSINFTKYLNNKNTIIQYFGSYLRQNAFDLAEFHKDTGIKGLTWCDWTMQKHAGEMFYHVTDPFDISKVQIRPRISVSDDTIRIVHSPTNREFKKTDFFLSIYKELEKKYNLELILLEGLSNKECLKQKQLAHINYDQISVGRFALSAIESMAMEQIVLCSVSNIVMSRYPDCPVVPVTKNNLKNVLEDLIMHPYKISEYGVAGRKWVKRHCDPLIVLKQYLYLYDLIINGNRLIENKNELIITTE